MALQRFIILLLSLGLFACTQSETTPSLNATGSEQNLYSLTGQEYQVHFKALYRTTAKRVEDLNSFSLPSRIKDTTQFLFGPLTQRQLGGVQKGEKIQPLLDQAYIENDRVVVPYNYNATWMLLKSGVIENSLRLPLPFSEQDLKTAQWKNCTDSSEDHSTWDFFWYYWDPERRGCDHRLNVHYQEVDVVIGQATPQTTTSYPEYSRMIRNKNGTPTLSMTFAFGYVEDVSFPNPFTDSDFGMSEFRRFYFFTKAQLLALGFKEELVYQSAVTYGNGVIGSKFVGTKDGVRVEVSVLAAAGIDQMDLFAHSYAQNHEGFFGWFGHSRVGSGFDAQTFEYKLRRNPRQYSLTADYQLVYWAGCNSYSYYTLPFFELKSQLAPDTDPQGTRNLDLISNTLPSLFAFNAANAQVLFQALLNWKQPTSYQSIIQKIEKTGSNWGTEVIVNVLGDEDNQN